MLDFLATQFYERKHLNSSETKTSSSKASTSTAHIAESSSQFITIDEDQGEIQETDMHIIGMHVHAAAHKHAHAPGHGSMPDHGQIHARKHGEVQLSSHGRHVVVAQVINALILIGHICFHLSIIDILMFARYLFSIMD